MSDRPVAFDLASPRSSPDILAATFTLYGRFPLLFFMLAIGVVAPFDLAVLAITGYGPLGQQAGSASDTLILTIVDYTLVGPLISALHVHAVAEIGQRKRPALGDVARRGLMVLPVVAATEIIAALGIIAGLVALIVPGVILLLRWAVAAQAAAIDNAGWQAALRRSGELARGNYLHILGLVLMVGVITSIAVAPLNAAASGHAAGAGVVALGIVVHTIARSFAALTIALLFFDLLARKNAPAPTTPPAPELEPEPQPEPQPEPEHAPPPPNPFGREDDD